MTEVKKVKIPRERASFPAVVIAFLLFSIVFFLSTVGARQEKAVLSHTTEAGFSSREIALEDMRCYLIALSGGGEAENARIDSARYMKRGAAGYLMERNGQWFSIGNMYFSKEEADLITEHLLKNGINASVIELNEKGVTLRVTADEDTLDALSFCVSAFREYEESLMNFSYRLDAGELSKREARVLLSVLYYDLSEKRAEAEKALKTLDKNAAKEIFAMYLNLLDDVSSLTKNEGGEMMLSARIKYALIDHALLKISLLKYARA